MTVLRFLVLLAASSACACGALTPYASAPAPLPAGVTDHRQRVGICANPLKTTPQQVQQLAQAECLGNTVAEQVTGDDYRLDVCPLAVPARVTFACAARK